MNAFKHFSPTAVFFGEYCIKNNAAFIATLGKRAYIITSKFPNGCRNYALEDAEETLLGLGIEYEITSDVQENPPVSNIVHMTNAIREYAPDFLLGVGGGSSIDSAKAVSVLIGQPADCDAAAMFFDGPVPFDANKGVGTLPVIAVPTTAGTGAEVSCFSVLTNEQTHTKRAIAQPVFCEAAFLDSRYIREAPAFIIHTGALDALAHGVECYVNNTSNCINRSLAEIGFKLFSQYKDNMLNNCLTNEDFDKLILVSNIMGVAFMRSGTTLPHGMGYPLSHFKHVSHGLACSITLGEYLKIFKDESIVMPIVEQCGFKSVDEFADYLSVIIARDLHIEVSEQEIDQWAEDFFSLKYRLAKHPEPVVFEDIKNIYSNSLKNYIR